MAPLEQRSEDLRNLYPSRDDSMDELSVETRSYLNVKKENQVAGRDNSGDWPHNGDSWTATGTSAFPTSTSPDDFSVASPSSSSSSASLFFPLTSSPITTLSAIINTQPSALPTASSSQDIKGVSPGTSGFALSTPTPSQIPPVAASTLTPTGPDGESHALSSTAQHILISAATIGAIVFIGTIIYCVLRFLKIDVISRFRRFPRKGRGSWRPGSFSGTENYCPPYSSLSDEKFIPSVRKPYAPVLIEPVQMGVLPSSQELARVDSERQKLVREALLDKLEDTALYHETLQSGPEPQPVRQPSVAYTHNRPFSELSSLSSGFGDAKIDIPETGPTKTNNKRKSRASRASQKDINYSRFSWSSSPTTLGRGKGNRDTIYTSTTTHTTHTAVTSSSEESGPRFRTVNSWVTSQAKRVQRQKHHDREIDSIPALPAEAHVKRAHHQRLLSEVTEPGFKYHPGDEVPLVRGSRVPSAILDKII